MSKSKASKSKAGGAVSVADVLAGAVSAPKNATKPASKAQKGIAKDRSAAKRPEVAVSAPKSAKAQKNAKESKPAVSTKKSKDAVVSENSRGVRAAWRGFGACALLRYLAAEGHANPVVRFILDQIGLAQVDDDTIGCQCGATRSAMNGKRAEGVSAKDAARGVSFRGTPADVKGENAAFLKAVAKRYKPE